MASPGIYTWGGRSDSNSKVASRAVRSGTPTPPHPCSNSAVNIAWLNHIRPVVLLCRDRTILDCYSAVMSINKDLNTIARKNTVCRRRHGSISTFQAMRIIAKPDKTVE